MVRSGAEYLAGLDDDRQVFVNGERVAQVATSEAFHGAANTFARTFDVVRDPQNLEITTFESPKTGERVNMSYHIPRNAEDLAARRHAERLSAEVSMGFMGRSLDNMGCILAGQAGSRHVFDAAGKEFGDNVVRFYEKARDEDLFVTGVVIPPQIDRSKPPHQQQDKYLYAGVKEERDGGIVLAGAQMLGTNTALSDYLWISCIVPLGPGDEDYAISVVLPVNSPGLRLHSRRPYAPAANSVFDYPLASQFDEVDTMVVLDDVFVPWENVFVYRNLEILRRQFAETAGHPLAQHQSQIRLATKLQFITGLTKRIADMNGSTKMVTGLLGELAAYASQVEGMLRAQEVECAIGEGGVAIPRWEYVYSTVALQSEIYPRVMHIVREISGGGMLQLPSSVKDYENPVMAADLNRFVQSPGYSSIDRVKLMKLAWDVVGSEFGGRHHQYEMFYAGAPFLTKSRMYTSFDFDKAGSMVDQVLGSYDPTGLTYSN